MSKLFFYLLCAVLPIHHSSGEPDPPKSAPPATHQSIADKLKTHDLGAKKLGAEQDDLSADVQDLYEEQTDVEVKKLLRQVEEIMADATDRLEISKTDGATIAIQTEIIEKIFEAAKKKEQQGGGG